MYTPWLSIIFLILASAIMDHVRLAIGCIMDLILLMRYPVDLFVSFSTSVTTIPPCKQIMQGTNLEVNKGCLSEVVVISYPSWLFPTTCITLVEFSYG
jgi:hypothetical protein